MMVLRILPVAESRMSSFHRYVKVYICVCICI